MNTVNLSGVIATVPKFEISEKSTKDLLANFCLKNITKGGKTSYIWCSVIGNLAQKVMLLNRGNYVLIEGELVCYNQNSYYFYTVEVNSLEVFKNKENQNIDIEEIKVIEKIERNYFGVNIREEKDNLNDLKKLELFNKE